MPKKKQARNKKKTTAKQVEILKKLAPLPIEGEVIEEPKIDRFGRPSVVNEQVKKRMMEAFAWGCSNAEAALHAGISLNTLDRYFKKDPDFKDRAEQLKDSPTLLARATLVRSLKDSPFYSLKYLERKKSNEFSVRITQTFEEPDPLSPEEEAEIKELFDEDY